MSIIAMQGIRQNHQSFQARALSKTNQNQQNSISFVAENKNTAEHQPEHMSIATKIALGTGAVALACYTRGILKTGKLFSLETLKAANEFKKDCPLKAEAAEVKVENIEPKTVKPPAASAQKEVKKETTTIPPENIKPEIANQPASELPPENKKEITVRAVENTKAKQAEYCTILGSLEHKSQMKQYLKQQESILAEKLKSTRFDEAEIHKTASSEEEAASIVEMLKQERNKIIKPHNESYDSANDAYTRYSQEYSWRY